jgi:CheY-like chemotaxis protein
LTLQENDFNLRNAVEDVASLLSARAYEKGLKLNLWFDGKVPWSVRGDSNRLRQILMNLVGNAIKFTDQGEVLIVVSKPEGSDRLVRFEIRDTGVGIPVENQERIFDPFQQADGSSTRAHSGTGLGLSICRQLVEAMGGEISLESAPGKGSCFWCTLPFDEAESQEMEVHHPKLGDQVRGRHVLVVDDDATNRTILVQQTELWGMSAAEAGSAAEALEILRSRVRQERPFDLVILDMNMPSVNGLDLARSIQQDSSLTGLPLIMLSSVGQLLAAGQTSEAGICSVLTKPARQEELAKTLARVLSQSHQPEASVEVARSRKTGSFSSLRILLAEDNPVNRNVTAGMLQRLGHDLEVVENGGEAIEKAANEAFDLVLMDCQMPEVDGYEATRAIRETRKKGELPIIALTAHAMDGDRERCLIAGMDDYLSKPFTLDQLEGTLKKWLKTNGRRIRSKHFGEPVASDNSTAQEEVIDQNAIDHIRSLDEDGSQGFLDQIIRVYLDESEPWIGQLGKAVGEADAAAVHQAAHGLKSASANVGALRLSSLCRKLEEMGRVRTMHGAQEILPQVEQEYQAVRSALRGQLSALPQEKQQGVATGCHKP